MCIYYIGRLGLSFTTEEHVFLAALGGKLTLPKDFVSNEFNNDMSKLELDFVRYSIVAMPRELLGPGKRGSLSPKKAKKSDISVINNSTDPSKIALGYVVKGICFEIPHVKYNTITGLGSISIPKELSINKLTEFKLNLSKANEKKINTIIDNTLPIDEILLGFEETSSSTFSYYFAKNDSNPMTITASKIIDISNNIIANDKEPEHHKYYPMIRRQITIKDEHLRIYGKMAFNYLAHLKGKEFVLNPQFDNFRKWVAYGGENNFANFDFDFNIKQLNTLEMHFPQDSHFIYLFKSESSLCARVLLYANFSAILILSEQYIGEPLNDGFICDWKNSVEYTFDEYIEKEYNKISREVSK